MIVARIFWFRRGLEKFVADLNDTMRRTNMRLVRLDFHRGVFGLRWLACAVLEVPLCPLPKV